MDIRALPVSQGLSWVKQAIDLGARNPRAVFGASLLLIIAMYTAVIAVALLAAMMAGAGDATTAGQPDMRMAAMVAFPLFVLILLAVPVLLGGLMHVIRESESGRPVRARDVFAPLGQPQGRRLALLGLVQMAVAVVGGMLFTALAGADYWKDYMDAMRGAMSGTVPTMPQPDHPGLMFLLQLVFNYFSYALMLFSIPLMLFSGASLGEAVRGSLRAALRNVVPNLLAGALFMGGLLVAAMLVVLLIGLAMLVGNLIHGTVGSLLALLVGMSFASVAMVLLVGAAYLAWRDTFGDAASGGAASGDAAASPLLPHSIEV
ncbi:MAG: DUF2189 domain-containing protein [Pseudomonadota bacterium]|nr:DUF2189 domain-containing protein [Pseudomonadota bacterium]